MEYIETLWERQPPEYIILVQRVYICVSLLGKKLYGFMMVGREGKTYSHWEEREGYARESLDKLNANNNPESGSKTTAGCYEHQVQSASPT